MLNPLNSLSSLFQGSSLRGFTPDFNRSVDNPTSTAPVNLRVENRESFQLFNSILQNAYQRIASQTRPPELQTFQPGVEQPILKNGGAGEYVTPVGSGERVSAKQAAENILDFIAQRLRSDFADGATQEELQARLEQGRQGFLQGFSEAKEQIESLGLLTADLDEKITDTYNRVLEGLDRLAAKIDSKFSDDISNAIEVTNRFELQSQSSQQNSFSLNLTTQDGDIVTIDISRFQQQSFSAGFAANGDSASLQVSGSQSFSSNFSLTVQGELDEGELASINELLEDVNSIASDFYAGDLDSAFELAQQLEIDREELSSLNLQLQQTTVSQAYAAYESVAPEVLRPPVAELEQLISQVEGLLESARQFINPLELLRNSFAGIEELQENSPEKTGLFGRIDELVEQFQL